MKVKIRQNFSKVWTNMFITFSWK